jgi:serine/threonine protein kinase/tetratricopeptide (TPR) repeat protein
MNAAGRDADTLFAQAIEIAAPEERALFLEKACGHDPELRRELEKLVRDHFRAGEFLERPAAHIVATGDELPGEGPGTVLGPYKLLEQIGEGGMGLVFMAEQTRPVRRRVALKVLKPGMDTRQVVARFEAERQALALMDHPNIAKIHDAGATASGRPYFVMELVRGVPITEFCDRRRLTTRQRLELFVLVCQAVQHAHQKGIIHRDLKPSNVMVTLHDTVAVPKVIDFGIAKATTGPLTERTLFTNFAQLIGTPLYMSPEQAALSNVDVDTRSDIYSLGVLLYELLTGTTPFDKERLKEVGYDEMRRIIREEEPPRPSTRLSTLGQAAHTVSTQRKSDPKRLSQLFRGELDWIVMKALEKDRNRRYESASAFAADVLRYLADQPVLACPPSVWYRLRKFTWRNKAALAAGALVLLALVLGTIISSWQAIQATRARDAEQEARDALDAAREEKDQHRARTNRELSDALVEAARLQEKARAAGPGAADSANQLRATLGRARTLAASELADPVLVHRVRTLQEEVAQDEKDRRMVARVEELHVTRGDEAAHAAAFQDYGIPIADILAGTAPEGRVEETARRIAASPIRDWLVAALMACARDTGRYQRLFPVARRVEEKNRWRRQYFDARIRNDWEAVVRLARQPEALTQPPAILLAITEGWGRAAPPASETDLLREAQRRYPADVRINMALADLVLVEHADRHGLDESIGFHRAALAARPEDKALHRALAEGLRRAGQEDEAIAVHRQLTRLRAADVSDFLDLGLLLWMKKDRDLDGAIAVFRQALEIDPKSRRAHVALAFALRTKGDREGAADAERKAAEGDQKGSRDSTDRAYYWFGDKMSAERKWEESAAAYRKAFELEPRCAPAALKGLHRVLLMKGDREGASDAMRKFFELHPPGSPGFPLDLGEFLWGKEDWGAAATYYRKQVDLEPESYQAHIRLADSLWRSQPDLDGSIAACRKALQLFPADWYSRERLGDLLVAKGDWEGAIDTCRKAIKMYPMWKWSSVRFSLVQALAGKGDYEGAIAAFQEAVETVSAFPKLVRTRGGFSLLGGFPHPKGGIIAPAHHTVLNNFAWLLATCPQPKYRDPPRSVQLAKKATELAPTIGSFWNTLGVAQYRAGDWNAAVAALNKSRELGPGGDDRDYFYLATARQELRQCGDAQAWFFLAMAHRKLGHTDEARKWYDQAIRWINRNAAVLAKFPPASEELRRFRLEAEEVLELKKQ